MGMWYGNIAGGGASANLFTYQLKAGGTISEETFSTYFQTTANGSFIEFGPINDASMKNRNDLAWIPVTAGSNYWQSTVSGFKWGTHSDTTNFPQTDRAGTWTA